MWNWIHCCSATTPCIWICLTAQQCIQIIMSFYLCKMLCNVTHILDEDDCPPNNGTEYCPGDFPVYYNLLYYPAMHSYVFSSPVLVCGWLRSCFQAESLWTDVHVKFHEGLFYVEDISTSLQVCLSPLDIPSIRFHPQLLLDRHVSGENRCNPSWVYVLETNLADSFDGITVRTMTMITGRSRTLRTQGNAIQCICRMEKTQVLYMFTDALQPFQYHVHISGIQYQYSPRTYVNWGMPQRTRSHSLQSAQTAVHWWEQARFHYLVSGPMHNERYCEFVLTKA